MNCAGVGKKKYQKWRSASVFPRMVRTRQVEHNTNSDPHESETNRRNSRRAKYNRPNTMTRNSAGLGATLAEQRTAYRSDSQGTRRARRSDISTPSLLIVSVLVVSCTYRTTGELNLYF